VGLKFNGTHQLLVYADDVNLLGDNIDKIKKNLPYRLSTSYFTAKFSLEFEVLTVVTRKSTVFWVVIPCIPATLNRRFNATYRLQHQGRSVSHAIRVYQWKQAAVCLFLLCHTLIS
jgi:hypothetical protein